MYRRRMRTHMAWNVNTHSPSVSTMAARRVRISSAALLVNVMAKILYGRTPQSSMRCAMRWVSRRVLPLPAPAVTSTGPSV